MVVKGSDLIVIHQLGKFLIQGFFVFHPFWIGDNDIQWTNTDAGWRIIKTHTLGTQIWIDFVDFVAHINRFIRAFWLTHIAINAAV